MQPVRGSNEIWAAYFIVFLLLGAFFLLELFVGVIVENFARYGLDRWCCLVLHVVVFLTILDIQNERNQRAWTHDSFSKRVGINPDFCNEDQAGKTICATCSQTPSCLLRFCNAKSESVV